MAAAVVVLLKKRQTMRRENNLKTSNSDDEADLEFEEASPKAHASGSLSHHSFESVPSGKGNDFEPATTNEDDQDADAVLLRKLLKKVNELKEKKVNYCNLASFLAFVALYMAVLFLQQQSFLTYKINSAHRLLLPPDPFVFESQDQFYSWINDSILSTIYKDPACGDGVCSSPEEFPGFGRFGCHADCGHFRKVTPVTVRMATSFLSTDDQASSSWNLCLVQPAYFCWFENPRTFSGSLGNSFREVHSIPDGEWQIVITAPNGGVIGQVDIDDTNADALGANRFINLTKTLTSWGNCKEKSKSILNKCRQTCARYAVCAAMACENLGPPNMADITGDCYAVCDQDPSSIVLAYSNATCYDVACDLNSTSSFLAIHKDFSACRPDTNFDGRSPDRGLEGLTFLGSRVLGYDTPAKPASSRYCGLSSSRRKVLEFSKPPKFHFPHPRVRSGQAKDPSGSWRRRNMVSQLSEAATSQANNTSSYWAYLGASDHDRLRNLEISVARALYTWSKSPCTCPKDLYIEPKANAARFVAFFCTLLGGPADLAGCNYTSPVTGRQLTSDADLAATVLAAHKRRNLTFAQDQQDNFINTLISSVASTLPLTSTMLWQLSDRVHDLDEALVNSALPPSCNAGTVTLSWKQGANYDTTVPLGSTVTWVWEDSNPHSIREVTSGNGSRAEFRGFGSGKLLVARDTLCTPENTGYLNVSQLPPRPCSVVDVESLVSRTSFSYSWRFDTLGKFEYEDGRMGSLMKGTLTVVQPDDRYNPHPPPSRAECAPGCPLWHIRNGQCLAACNVAVCNFDGGDCSCSDHSTGSDSCTCYPGQTKGEEGDCCEPETVGTDLRFNFILKQFGDALSYGNSPFLPDPGYVKDRIFAQKNRLVMGMLIHTIRGTTHRCSQSKFGSLFWTCIGSQVSRAPYGVDPVFLHTSEIYNPNVNASKYYPLPEQFNSNRIPIGFYYRKIKGYPDGFPVLFDINLSHGQAVQRLQYLIDGFFLDNATTGVLVQLILFNGEQQKFVDVEVECTFQKGGKLAIASSIDTVAMDLYHTVPDWVRAVLELFLFTLVCFQLAGELRQWLSLWQQSGSPGEYFRSNWNIVDLLSLTILLLCGILWISIYASRMATFTISKRYDVYSDLMTFANFWGLRGNGEGLDKALSRFAEIHQIIALRSIYMAINGISLFVVMLRLLKFLHFQPRMGIITRSLSIAGPELSNFLLLLTTMFVIYSTTAHLVFGRTLDQYRSLAISFVTNFNLIVGDTSVAADLLLLQGWELAAGQIFYWTFVTLFTFVLMNFVIAILVDAFVEAKGPDAEAPSIAEEVVDVLRLEVEALIRGHLSDKALACHLSTWTPADSSAPTPPPTKSYGLLSSLIDRLTNREQCIQVPLEEGADGLQEPLMAQLDYPTVLSILSRGASKAAKDVPKELPDKVTRSLFIRFGETPRLVTKVKETRVKKRKMGYDALALKEIMERVEDRLVTIQEHLDSLTTCQMELSNRLSAIESSPPRVASQGSPSKIDPLVLGQEQLPHEHPDQIGPQDRQRAQAYQPLLPEQHNWHEGKK